MDENPYLSPQAEPVTPVAKEVPLVSSPLAKWAGRCWGLAALLIVAVVFVAVALSGTRPTPELRNALQTMLVLVVIAAAVALVLTLIALVHTPPKAKETEP